MWQQFGIAVPGRASGVPYWPFPFNRSYPGASVLVGRGSELKEPYP